MRFVLPLCLSFVIVFLSATLPAQQPPAIGYMYPAGCKAGKTIEVTLGGYDWTPDMQVFVHDPRVSLEIVGELGPVVVPEPPYWFGKKARRSPFMLPREVRARLTVPADVEDSVIRWQVANANGASTTGRFIVSSIPSILDTGERKAIQQIDSLPLTIDGQIKHIEEVDTYQLSIPNSGLITGSIYVNRIASPLIPAVEIVDERGLSVVDIAATSRDDISFAFNAIGGQHYLVKVYDVDFRGNRSFVYRLDLRNGPSIESALPATGQRGATQPVKLIGFGLATGKARLESITHEVTFPANPQADSFSYVLDTSHGETAPFRFQLSDSQQSVESADRKLAVPTIVHGTLEDRRGEDVYTLDLKKGEVVFIEATATAVNSTLDPLINVYDVENNAIQTNDDVAALLDSHLHFKSPVDGTYTIGLRDAGTMAGSPTATYQLSVRSVKPGFEITTPEIINAQIGGKSRLTLKATRTPGFADAIAISLVNAPEGVTIPENASIPERRPSANIEISVDEKAAANAALIRIRAESVSKEEDAVPVTFESKPILLATTIKPPFTIDAEGKNDVLKWPRGSTFPGIVLIERDEGFTEDIRLEMTSRQGRHRQGIRGPEVIVPDGVARHVYPVTLPEWLETTRTSRMVVNGVAQVKAPKGNPRWSLVKQKNRMGFLPTGALMKIASEQDELEVAAGSTVRIPVRLSSDRSLSELTTLELVVPEEFKGLVTAETITMNAASRSFEFPVAISDAATNGMEIPVSIKATLTKDESNHLESETRVLLLIGQ